MISSAAVEVASPTVTVASPASAIATWPVTSSPVNAMSRTWASGALTRALAAG